MPGPAGKNKHQHLQTAGQEREASHKEPSAKSCLFFSCTDGILIEYQTHGYNVGLLNALKSLLYYKNESYRNNAGPVVRSTQFIATQVCILSNTGDKPKVDRSTVILFFLVSG